MSGLSDGPAHAYEQPGNQVEPKEKRKQDDGAPGKSLHSCKSSDSMSLLREVIVRPQARRNLHRQREPDNRKDLLPESYDA